MYARNLETIYSALLGIDPFTLCMHCASEPELVLVYFGPIGRGPPTNLML